MLKSDATPATTAVKSASRALKILDLLTATERPMTFAEILKVVRYPRSSLHGLLQTLTEYGWLELDEKTRTYSLGVRTWEAGHAYMRAVSLADRAIPYMTQVRDAVDETVQLGVLDGTDNIYIAKVTGSQRLVLASEVGRRLPAHATGLGKVLLAGLDSAELKRRLEGARLERFTQSTITDLESLRHELARTQKRGYGTDNEEYTVGVRCIAAPIRDSSGAVVAAMSISVPTVRDRVLRAARDLLITSAARLSSALGYNGTGSARRSARRPA